MSDENSLPWWRRPSRIAALFVAAIVPLIWPAFPPLTDLPGHAARWQVALAGPASPLSHYYAIHWQWIGNLGADLIGVPLGALVGVELAAKLIVMLVVPLTMAGMLWLSREAHGRIAPTALLALPFAYGWPLQMGFINFALAQALALCSFALWLRLARLERLKLRAALFAAIGLILWTAHSAGWGLFGLMAFGGELARLRKAGKSWPTAIGGAVLACLPLALPLAIMLGHHGGDPRSSQTGDWFNLPAKFLWVISSLRDRWAGWDVAALAVPLLALYAAARDRRLGFDPLIGWPALFCLAGFLLLPRLLLGGSYVDMRMMPMVWTLALLAIRPPEDPRLAQRLALIGLAFFAARTVGTAISFVQRDAEQRVELDALARIPRGAPVLALVSEPCLNPWSTLRAEHLPAYAIIRREAFVNEQWAIPGQQYLRVRYAKAYPLIADPSQLVYPKGCVDQGNSLDETLASFRHAAFTHVWLINGWLDEPKRWGLRPIWTNGRSALYEVIGSAGASRVEARR